MALKNDCSGSNTMARVAAGTLLTVAPTFFHFLECDVVAVIDDAIAREEPADGVAAGVGERCYLAHPSETYRTVRLRDS